MFSYPEFINNQIFGMNLTEKHWMFLIAGISYSLRHSLVPWNAKCPPNQGERGDSGLSSLWHCLKAFCTGLVLEFSKRLAFLLAAAGSPLACCALQRTVLLLQLLPVPLSDLHTVSLSLIPGALCPPAVYNLPSLPCLCFGGLGESFPWFCFKCHPQRQVVSYSSLAFANIVVGSIIQRTML